MNTWRSAIGGHAVEDVADRCFGVGLGQDFNTASRRHVIGSVSVMQDPVIALKVEARDVVVGRCDIQIDCTIGTGDKASYRVQNDLNGFLRPAYNHPGTRTGVNLGGHCRFWRKCDRAPGEESEGR